MSEFKWLTNNPDFGSLDSLKFFLWVFLWTLLWALLDYITYLFIKPVGEHYIPKEEPPGLKKKEATDSQAPIETKIIPNLKDAELLQNVHQRHVVDEKTTTEGDIHAANSTTLDHQNQKLTEKNDKIPNQLSPQMLKMKKFERSGWRFFNYSIMFGICLYLYSQESFAFQFNARTYFDGWPEKVSPNMNTIYAMEIGHYIYALMVIPLEPKQKDKLILFIHHLTALLLLIGSHCNSFCRIGVPLVLITDISDPILEGAKAFQYMGFQRVADVGFNFFAVIFIVFRNIVFPYAIVIPSFDPLCWEKPGTYPLRILLFVLQCLFLYWTYLIFNIARNVLAGRGATDIRDEED